MSRNARGKGRADHDTDDEMVIDRMWRGVWDLWIGSALSGLDRGAQAGIEQRFGSLEQGDTREQAVAICLAEGGQEARGVRASGVAFGSCFGTIALSAVVARFGGSVSTQIRFGGCFAADGRRDQIPDQAGQARADRVSDRLFGARPVDVSQIECISRCVSSGESSSEDPIGQFESDRKSVHR